ncbi:MAG: hypothetical protein AB1391_00075 [Candidatus Micrarchaeota archaeon]
MEDLIIIIADIIILVILLVVLYTVGKRETTKIVEGKTDKNLAEIAREMHAIIKDEEILLERNGLKMKYAFKVSKSGETNAIHHSFSTETGKELKQYCIIRPIQTKKQIEIYPKTDFSAYLPSEIKRLLEIDEDGNVSYFMNEEYGIFVNIGGNCISPQLGLFMGKKNIIIVDTFAEFSKGNRFYSFFSDKLTKNEEAEFGNYWKNLITHGFDILENIAKIAENREGNGEEK